MVAAAEPPDVVVTAAPETVTLAKGASAQITVTIQRRAGFDRSLPLILLGLPPGVTAETPEIPKDKSEAKITLKAGGDAAPVEVDLALAGKIVIDNERQTLHAAPPITLTVTAPVATLLPASPRESSWQPSAKIRKPVAREG
jgi:hypothetical protein